MKRTVALLIVATACGQPSQNVGSQPASGDEGAADAGLSSDSGASIAVDGGVDSGPLPDAGMTTTGNPFIDAVARFTPGESAGFGQNQFPGIVFGAPQGAGERSGSLHVLSLGFGGSIEVQFTDVMAIDGPGADFTVFENPFIGFAELGAVAVSEDGVTWREFPCDINNMKGGFPGCAGVKPVFSRPDNGISPVDPAVSGGDTFDLAEVGLKQARFVRIRDLKTTRMCIPPACGFDLDAIAVIHGESIAAP